MPWPSGRLWRMAAASVRGVGHVRNGQDCQDAHHWVETPSGILVAAVADGAGSAAVAEVGSALASRAAVDTAAAHLDAAANDVARLRVAPASSVLERKFWAPQKGCTAAHPSYRSASRGVDQCLVECDAEPAPHCSNTVEVLA